MSVAYFQMKPIPNLGTPILLTGTFSYESMPQFWTESFLLLRQNERTLRPLGWARVGGGPQSDTDWTILKSEPKATAADAVDAAKGIAFTLLSVRATSLGDESSLNSDEWTFDSIGLEDLKRIKRFTDSEGLFLNLSKKAKCIALKEELLSLEGVTSYERVTFDGYKKLKEPASGQIADAEDLEKEEE